MYKQQLTRKSLSTIIAGLGMAAIVSGCSSSAEDSVVTAASTYADSEKETLAAHTSDDGKLESNALTLIRSKTPVTRGKTIVSIQPGEDNLKITALGKTVTYTKEDENTKEDEKSEDGWVFYENEEGFVAFNGSSYKDVVDGNTPYKYMTPVKGGVETVAKEKWDRYYAVVGLETPEANLEGKANASYSGSFSLDSYPVDDPKTELRDHGNVGLTANFEEGKINGGLTFSPGSEDELEVDLAETDISGNSFATTFSHETDTEKSTGEFAGKFYGNEAQEAGGTIATNYQETVDGVTTTNEVGAGTWTAEVDAAD